MDLIKQKLIRIALASRFFLWALAFVADLFIPNHDAGVFTWTLASTIKYPTIGDRIIGWFTDGTNFFLKLHLACMSKFF